MSFASQKKSFLYMYDVITSQKKKLWSILLLEQLNLNSEP
jgi:hypothetical protein